MTKLRIIFGVWFGVTLSLVGEGAFVVPPVDSEGFVSLFNGKDLSGWGGKPGWWFVEDGAITVESTPEKPCKVHNYLMWRGGEPADFELQLDYRIEGGNSGIQFRSQELPGWDIRGYQADMEAGSQWSGALFEHDRGGLAMRGQKVEITKNGRKLIEQFADPALLLSHISPGAWNRYRVVARGSDIRLLINGTLMSQTIDAELGKAARKGILALQMHPGPPMKVQFRNLRLKTLSPQTSHESNQLTCSKGFQVDLIYSPDRKREGSWGAMCVDSRGRLIVGNQYDEGLFRITLPSVDESVSEVLVEKINAPLSGVQGLTWYEGSLYGVVSKNGQMASGLYRVRDKDGDDQLESVELLQPLHGGGDHGWHGIVVGPQKQSLYLVAGNNTLSPMNILSRVPKIWSEDHILPRMPDARGHMKGLLAPGGCVYRVDPSGREWELLSNGYRNPYDIAFNRDGELFAYDADMEWDMNTPWYRPTRVCHVTSGSEFGWRNGSGKWPSYYPDSLPACVDTGPGSPTGITFGYGSSFPAEYNEALFVGDWSYGRVYAVHLTPDGATYAGRSELVISGTPFPVTDMVVNKEDGAMYITTGGWRIQSGLFRVTHTGAGAKSKTRTVEGTAEVALRKTRRRLEAFHGRRDPEAVSLAWPSLGHPDRFIRFAARVVLEWQDPELWRKRALVETDPQAALTALLALARVSGRDQHHRDESDPLPDPRLQNQLLQALERVDWLMLSETQRLELLRVYSVFFSRQGDPGPSVRRWIRGKLSPLFPANTRALNSELCRLLVYLDSDTVARKALKLVAEAPTQEEQLDYIKSLRVLKSGWTPELRRDYFAWFRRAASYHGGASFHGYVKMIKDDSIASLSEKERTALQPLLAETDLEQVQGAELGFALAGRSEERQWTVAELEPYLESGMKDRDIERGRQLFGATGCFACHRFANEGGAMGPDLTGAGRRFTTRDLLESILEPNRAISDLYCNTTMHRRDGETIVGRIVYLGQDSVTVNRNMFDPSQTITLDRKSILSMERSEVSPMPEGLLNLLEKEEILDLIAYLVSGGNG